MANPHNIDWSKVKKSPIPKGDEGSLLGWYRGSGIKIAIYADAMWIMDAENDDRFITTLKGDYTKLDTGEVKATAQKAIDDHYRGLAVVPLRYEKIEKVRRRSGMKGRVKLVGMRHRSRSGRKVAYR